MKTILGITDGDDAGAVLLIDGRIIAGVNEERLNRMKLSIGFPHLAVKEVMRLGDVTPADIDEVAMAAHTESWVDHSQPNKGWFARGTMAQRVTKEIASAMVGPLGRSNTAIKGFRYLKKATVGARRRKVRETLQSIGLTAPVSYHEHHRCHALASYQASGFESAVSISLDGSGDGSCSHIWRFSEREEKLTHRVDSIHSVGNFYAYVTHLCGFRANIHEGKITGLAASGEPRYIDVFRDLIRYQDGEIVNAGRVYYKSAIRKLNKMLPKDWKREDLAASVQRHLEETVLPYVSYWIGQSGESKVCLSGGVFANVLLNQKIAEIPECKEVFVFPAMGDGGLAAGAACSAHRKAAQNGAPSASFLPHAYLGPAFSDSEIEADLKESGLDFTRYDDIEDTIARLLFEGKVVARFNGAMEYGPRALGNRSILYRPTDRSVNDWLNKRLNRTEFMPFAPACMSGYEKRLFRWHPASARAARFMTVTMDCTEWMQEHCPAVVHIDATARPQIVDAETNPSFYRVIECFNELSGIPVVVNTSFNMHEEPIVCTPKDAVRAYQLGRLDNLAIGSFLLGQPPGQE